MGRLSTTECTYLPTSFEICLRHQLVQGLASPKERPRARKICTKRVYCIARVGIPGCRSLESLPFWERGSGYSRLEGRGRRGLLWRWVDEGGGGPTPRGGQSKKGGG